MVGFLLDSLFAIALSTGCVCLEKVCSVRPSFFILCFYLLYFFLFCYVFLPTLLFYLFIYNYFLLDALCFVIGAFLE